MRARYLIAGVATLACLAGPVAFGAAPKQTIEDERKTGDLYPASTYKNCDVSKLETTVKRGKLKVKTFFRGKLQGSLQLNLSIGKSKGGEPDYWVQTGGSSTEGFITKTGGVDDFGNAENSKPVDKKASVDSAKGGAEVTIAVPLKAIGKPKNTGYQIQTCGEGSVDLAPGKNHVDDTNYQGRPDYKFAVIKTGD